MIPYIFLALFLLILAIYSSILKERNTIILVFLSLFLLAFFRDLSVGSDFNHYKEIFLKTGDNNFNNRLELAWALIYSIFYKIANFRIYVFFYYFILYIFLLKFIWKESYYPIYAVLFYVLLGYYFETYNIMRQSFAALFALFSVNYIINRKIFSFSLLILAGSLFHISLLLFFPLYFILPWIFNKKKILVLGLILTLILGFFSRSILLSLTSNFTLIERYEVYLTVFRDNISFMGAFINIVHTAIAIIAVIYVKDQKTKYYLTLTVIGISLNNLFFQFQWLFRLYNPLLIIFIIITLPNLINDIKIINNKRLLILIIAIYGLGMFYTLLKNNASGVVPYYLFF
ncbi:MAG TPA: hypothetical protein DCG75_14350 [Bacteroidales bacterium]|nr:hypothetical protein [Bacteroidales bacterium]